MARISKVSVEEAIQRIHTAGLDSFAGAGAELLPERPRKAIAPLKESGERWLEIMEIAHRLGVESTSTMLMGTGETNAERIEHLRMIRDVQDRTGGFRAFIPYTYQPENNHLKGRTQSHALRVPADDRHRPAVHGQRRPHPGLLAHDGQEVGQAPPCTTAPTTSARSCWRRTSSCRRPVPSTAQPAGDHRPDPQAGRVPAQRATTYEHLVVHDDPANDPVDERVVSHISSTAIEGGTAHPELKLLASN